MLTRCIIKTLPVAIKSYNKLGNVFIPNHKSVAVFNITHNNIHNRVIQREYCTLNEHTPHVEKIYNGVLSSQIRAVKIFSLSSSLMGLICQPLLYKEISALNNVPMMVAIYSFVGFFTIVTPLLLHLITKKYVIQLEYNKKTDTYIAKTLNLFCVVKEIEFNSSQVKVPVLPRMFTTLIANGHSMFLDPRCFEDGSHYAKLMGYDKPIDFTTYEKNKKDTW